jgi:hypothetical protein
MTAWGPWAGGAVNFVAAKTRRPRERCRNRSFVSEACGQSGPKLGPVILLAIGLAALMAFPALVKAQTGLPNPVFPPTPGACGHGDPGDNNVVFTSSQTWATGFDVEMDRPPFLRPWRGLCGSRWWTSISACKRNS